MNSKINLHPTAVCDRATQYNKPPTPVKTVINQSQRHDDSDISIVQPSRLTTWMSSNWIQNMPINKLTIPGAHNAHAYKIVGQFPIALDHVICQNYNVYDLLCLGIRALDVSLLDDRWCCVGRWRTTRFVELANLVGRFANKYPNEVIFLIMNNGFNQMGSDITSVETVLQEASGFRVAKTVNPSCRVSDFTQSDHNIIIFWQGKADRMFLSDSWNYTRQVKPEELVRDCEIWSKQQPLKAIDPNKLKVVSCHVTPPADIYAIGADLLNMDKSIAERAKEVNSYARVRLLSTDVTEKVHFIMLDYVPQDVVEYLIQANFRE